MSEPVSPPPPQNTLRQYLLASGLATILVVGAAVVTSLFSKRLKFGDVGNTVLTEVDAAGVQLANKVLPCVVSIDTTSHRASDQWLIGADLRARFVNMEEENEYGIGSGVVVSPEGHIVTNFHVIRSLDLSNSQDRLDVWLHGSSQPEPVVLLGSDEALDIAVLKLTTPKSGLPHLRWGNSDEMRMGSLVFAFGSPFGLSETMTSGRISNNHRTLQGTGDAMRYFQTDCVINPGNSGGPLVNYRGDLIGINWAIYSDQVEDKSWQGVGLVLPGNQVKQAVEAIIEKRSPAPYLGLDFGEKTGESGVRVLITMVDKGSPASKAGLRAGDTVTQVDGTTPANAMEAWKAVRTASKQGNVPFVTLRDGQEQAQEVRLRP
jgi:serine protease Do